MQSRRKFIKNASLASAFIATSNLMLAEVKDDIPGIKDLQKDKFAFRSTFGVGGVAAGNGFHENTDEQINLTLQADWDGGVRYFDTAPFYGLGLSERRLGNFLFHKKRDEYILSTKVGRILEPDSNFTAHSDFLFKGKLNFKSKYDYSASGVRRSIEDSLQRLGLSTIDFVFVHDLSPDNTDLTDWNEQFNIAQKGAFPELIKMREEGIIKGWGLGVNRPEPILKTMEVSDPNLMLVASQYSLLSHKSTLNNLFPEMHKRAIHAVVGSPLNAGFLAGKERYNYDGKIPHEMIIKRKKIQVIADNYQVDIRTIALQFASAHPVVSAIIPGSSSPQQAIENIVSMNKLVPEKLWKDLKKQKLIEENAPVLLRNF